MMYKYKSPVYTKNSVDINSSDGIHLYTNKISKTNLYNVELESNFLIEDVKNTIRDALNKNDIKFVVNEGFFPIKSFIKCKNMDQVFKLTNFNVVFHFGALDGIDVNDDVVNYYSLENQNNFREFTGFTLKDGTLGITNSINNLDTFKPESDILILKSPWYKTNINNFYQIQTINGTCTLYTNLKVITFTQAQNLYPARSSFDIKQAVLFLNNSGFRKIKIEDFVLGESEKIVAWFGTLTDIDINNLINERSTLG